MEAFDLSKVEIRWISKKDLTTVVIIDGLSYPEGWSNAGFSDILRGRGISGIVAVYRNVVVGYAVYKSLKDTTRIERFAVDPEFRRKGIGKMLYGHLIGKLTETDRSELVADVAAESLGTQLFLKSQGAKAKTTILEDGNMEFYKFKFVRPDLVKDSLKDPGVGFMPKNRIEKFMKGTT